MRPSEESPGDYLLCMSRGPLSTLELKIENKDVYYNMNDRTFDCLQMLIDYYGRKAIVEGQPLRAPVCKSPQTNVNCDEVSDEDAKSIYDALHTAMAALQQKLSRNIMHYGNLNLWATQRDSWINVHMKLKKTITDYRLYIYETKQHFKHIAVLKLSNAHIFECPKSLWIRSYCFQIYECQGKITTLHASSKESYQKWIQVLSEERVTRPTAISPSIRLCNAIRKSYRCCAPHSMHYALMNGTWGSINSTVAEMCTKIIKKCISNVTIQKFDLNLWSTETDSWIHVLMQLKNTVGGPKLIFNNKTKHLKCIDEIDLSDALLYKCHKSLWNRPYCFQICKSKGILMNLCASNLSNFRACIGVFAQRNCLN